MLADYLVVFGSKTDRNIKFSCRIYRCKSSDSACRIASVKYRTSLPSDWVVLSVRPTSVRDFRAWG